MHITVVCPQCRSRYQVDDALRGSKMRCPNSKCRSVFDVVGEGSPPPSPAPVPRPPAPGPSRPVQSGSVSDMVPMLSAEVAPAPPSPTPALGPNAADWRTGPPRSNGTPAAPATPAAKQPPPKQPAPKQPPPKPRTPPAPKQPAPAPPPEQPAVVDWRNTAPTAVPPGESRAAPVEMPFGSWDAPPVREPASPEEEEEALRQAKKKRARRTMIGMVAGLVLILGTGLIIAFIILNQSEESLFAEAKKMYEEGQYGEATVHFRKLIVKFPDSSQVVEYRFYATLSDLQASSGDLGISPALEQVNQFVIDNIQTAPGKKLLDEKGRDLGQLLVKASDRFLADKAADEDAANEGSLKAIDDTVGKTARLLPGSITPEERERISGHIKEYRVRIAVGKDRTKALGELTGLAKKPGAQGIKEFKYFLREKAKSIPGLEERPEAVKLIGEMHDAHVKGIRFLSATAETDPSTPRQLEDSEASLLLDPLVAGMRRAAIDEGALVLAVARGVLYALYPSNGQIKWAMRIGIDTANLPVRLPPTATHPNERLLVLSGDARQLTALDLDGRRLWERRLGSSCLGRPLIVNRRAYVPTVDGQVHEIELAAGKLLGRWQFGQPLSVGGVHQKGTNLVYFPADDTCVYVIDVVKKECEMVLYSNHLAGSLLGEPLVIGDDAAAVAAGMPAHLLLTQQSGIDETTLKLYELPIKDRHALPVTMEPQPRIRGWTSFTPYSDSEKVVCMSDSAHLGLFGIRQARNPEDPLLFPLIPGPMGVDLTGLFKRGEHQRRERSLVAHVQGDDLWVLAHGRLQRLEMRLGQRAGPQILARWKKPLELGWPLHAEQVRESPEGATLHLVTEEPMGRPMVLATAIDPEATENADVGDARVRWQRQLGMVCQGQLIELAGEVLAVDRAGGLFRFKAKDYKSDAGVRWMAAARDVSVAAGLDQGESEPPQLVRADDKTVFAIANPGGTRLLVRRYETPGDGGAPKVTEQEVDLQSARPAGNLAVLGESLLVPLNNGMLVRFTLPLGERAAPEAGPTWRSRVAGAAARCYIVPVGEEEFLMTDGAGGLTRWSWKKGAKFPDHILPPGRNTPPAVELNDRVRVVSAPLVLPRAKPADRFQVIVADSRGIVHLLYGDGLTTEHTWECGGRITAGPFLRGGHVGCVVDKNRLVWIDPTKDEKPVWQHKTAGEAIVGEPQLIDDLLVVCDEGGRYVGLNPATGVAAGEGYRLKAVVAPAAAAVPFGKGRAFAPLTDGTRILLSQDRLRARAGQARPDRSGRLRALRARPMPALRHRRGGTTARGDRVRRPVPRPHARRPRRRHRRGGAQPSDVGDGPGDHDQLRDPGQQGHGGDRGTPAVRDPLRPDRGRGAPDERRALDGRVRRRLHDRAGEPADHADPDRARTGLARPGPRHRARGGLVPGEHLGVRPSRRRRVPRRTAGPRGR